MSNGLHVPRLEKMYSRGVVDLLLLVIIVPLSVLAVCGLAVWVLCDWCIGVIRSVRPREL